MTYSVLKVPLNPNQPTNHNKQTYQTNILVSCKKGICLSCKTPFTVQIPSQTVRGIDRNKQVTVHKYAHRTKTETGI